MHTSLIVTVVALIALVAANILSRQLKAYGSGGISSLDLLQGRYVLGFLVMVGISVVVSGAITFLLNKGSGLFLGLTCAFSLFGLVLLVIGSRRVG